MKKLRAVFFDLDDTLYNDVDFRVSGFEAVARYVENRYSISAKLLLDVLMWLVKEKGFLRSGLFDEAICVIGGDRSINVMELVEEYRNHMPSINLYEDAREMLETLQEHYMLGLITGGSALVQRNKIMALGLEQFFSKYIIFTEKLGIDAQKPSPIPFRRMLNMADVLPEEACYIGDNPFIDFIGAKHSGLKTIRLLRGRYADIETVSEHCVDINIKTLRDLPDLLIK